MNNNSNDNNKNYGIYAQKERKLMSIYNKLEKIIYYPVLIILKKLKISPDIISIISVLCIVCFFIFINNKTISTILLFSHMILDALDGTLARFLKTDSEKGWFLDVFCDQIGVTIFSVAIVKLNIVDPSIIIYYTSVYHVAIIFCWARNKLNIPAYWSIRPRLILYVIYILYCLINFHITKVYNYSVLVLSILLSIQILRDFIKIRSKL